MRNRHYVRAVSDILLTCCRQDIALRGHRENADSINRGNFLEILSLLSKYDDIVRDRLEKGPRNAIYTSHGIQNTIINIMATIVRNKICDCVHETKDISKNEQMSISIRYLDPDSHSIKERFLTFIIASNLTAEYLTKYILDTLSLYNLDTKLIVSQGYDGASVMSGCVTGVQKRIRDVAPQAIYVHCHAHCLNLVLVDCVKSNSHCSDFFSLLQSLYNFMSTSKSHVVFMEKQKELYPDKQPRQLQSLSETRWACRYIYLSLEAIASTFDATLESIGEGSDKQKAVEAVGLFHLVNSFKFLSCLIIFLRIMRLTKSLSDQLQSSQLDYISAAQLIASTTETLKEIRTDKCWDQTYKYILEVAALHGIEVEDRRRKRRQTRPLALQEDYIAYESSGHHDHISNSDSLKIGIYYPVYAVRNR